MTAFETCLCHTDIMPAEELAQEPGNPCEKAPYSS